MLSFWNSNAASLTVALAFGLLSGLDREKHKDPDSSSEAAKVRRFRLVALLGAIAAQLESEIMVAVLGAGVVVLNVPFSSTNALVKLGAGQARRSCRRRSRIRAAAGQASSPCWQYSGLVATDMTSRRGMPP